MVLTSCFQTVFKIGHYVILLTTLCNVSLIYEGSFHIIPNTEVYRQRTSQYGLFLQIFKISQYLWSYLRDAVRINSFLFHLHLVANFFTQRYHERHRHQVNNLKANIRAKWKDKRIPWNLAKQPLDECKWGARVHSVQQNEALNSLHLHMHPQ